MATHDYDIANQSGAAFRTDLNNALAAIQSNNSNSSSPATTVAYQWWADTNAGVLKIRNSANNDWIELFQLDGTLTLEDGSQSAPALAFRDDLDTGIFSSAANSFNIATAGVERIEFNATECVVNDTGVNVDFRIETNGVSDAFYVDGGSSNVGIGTSSPSSTLHVDGDFTITSNQPKIFLTDNNNDSDYTIQNANGNFSIVDETNSTTRFIVDSSGRVLIAAASGTHKLHIKGNGGDGIKIENAGGTNSAVIDLKSTLSSYEKEYRLAVAGSDGAYATAKALFVRDQTAGVNRFEIQDGGDVKVSTGNLIIGTAGKGIDFSASAHNGGMTTEILNDYERGTFTATCSGIGGGTNPTFSAQTSSAAYIKVGDVVHYWIYLFDINCTNAGSGIIMVVSGFPFASGGHYYPGVITHNTVIGSGNVNSGYVNPNASTPHFIPIVGNSTNGAVPNTGNPLYIMLGGAYTSTAV